MLLLRSIVCIAILAGLGTAAGQDRDPAVSKVLALENVWSRAEANRDLKALDEMLDPGFTYVDPAGQVHTKADLLAAVQAGDGDRTAADGAIVYVHGNTAIVSGTYRGKRIDGVRANPVKLRFVDTWCRRGGSWLAVASIATPVHVGK